MGETRSLFEKSSAKTFLCVDGVFVRGFCVDGLFVRGLGKSFPYVDGLFVRGGTGLFVLLSQSLEKIYKFTIVIFVIMLYDKMISYVRRESCSVTSG